MVDFVHNPEVQLFTEFMEEFGSKLALQQITEQIRIVVPGDREEGMFHTSDAFSCNYKYIWYNERKANRLGLTQSERFACIAHELGHIFDTSDRWDTPQQTREMNADQFAVELGLGNSMISALEKLIDYNRDDEDLVEGMEERKRMIHV